MMRVKNFLGWILIFWIAAFTVFAAENKSSQLVDIVAQPIPHDIHFPISPVILNKWIAAGNMKAERAHAWNIWLGMTSDSDEIYRGKHLPIWETWYGYSDVFTLLPAKVNAANYLALQRKPLHEFVLPQQLLHLKNKEALQIVLGPVEQRLMSFNKFSPEAAVFITTPHAGPDGKNYHYNSQQELSALNNAWPSSTAIEDRGIANFPPRAIETKPVFSVVKATGLTPLPVWQGVTESTQPNVPVPSTWTNCVLIDPHGKTHHLRPATKLEIASANDGRGLSCKNYFYGSLSMLYSFRLSATEADVFSHARNGGVEKDDFAVLLAMHVTSHEVPFWTWQTFYWQPPGIDSPNNFPGSKADQPMSLKSPWKNYALVTSYSQTIMPEGIRMSIAFNPYLEPGLPDGLESNCMSCHAVAQVGKGSGLTFPQEYKTPVKIFSDPLYYNTEMTNTEFSWAVADAP